MPSFVPRATNASFLCLPLVTDGPRAAWSGVFSDVRKSAYSEMPPSWRKTSTRGPPSPFFFFFLGSRKSVSESSTPALRKASSSMRAASTS